MSTNKIYLGNDEIYQRINQDESSETSNNALVTYSDEPFVTYVGGNKYNCYLSTLSYEGDDYEYVVPPKLVLIEENSEDAKNKLVCETVIGFTYNVKSGYSTVKSNVKSYEPVTYSTSQIKNLSRMISDQTYVTKVLNIPSSSTTTDMSSMFSHCENLTSLDLSNFDTSNVTNMAYMFNSCNKLESLDLSGWDVSNVTNMNGMFSYCQKLTSLDLSSFDTSNVTNMNSMFSQCNNLTSLDLSGWDVSNVTTMELMFYYCNSLESLDLSSFDTSNLTNMRNMFYHCDNLTSLDLSNFDTSNVTDMSSMFYGCDKLTHIKCKQSFKDWCWAKQSTISLPTAMRSGGTGTWEIIPEETEES